METMEQIAQRLRQRRTELGMSYGELAEATGITKGTLQRYESGVIADIPARKLKAIAAALLVEPGWLLTGETAAPTLREQYGLEGDVEEMVEAMHKNPRLRVLFSRSAKMDAEGIEAVLRIVELMGRE